MPVFRLDVAELSPPRVDEDGFLHVEAIATRSGVFEYRDAASVRHEYRPDEEVFAPKAMETLRAAPVTVGHVDMVTPHNIRQLRVGVVEGEPRREGALLAVQLKLDDPATIDRVLNGTLRELSLGYRCDIEEQSGVAPDGKRYDMIQRNHRANHIALLEPGKARAGSVASIRLDAAEEKPDEKETPESEEKDAEKADQDPAEKSESEEKDTEKADQDPDEEPEKSVMDMQAEELALLRARVAEIEALLASALARAEAAEAAVSAYAREQLEKEIQEVAPEVRTDSVSDDDLRKQIVAKFLPSIRVDNVSGDFLRGSYAAALSVARTRTPNHKQVAGGPTADMSGDPVKAALNERNERFKNAWRGGKS